MRVFEHFIKTEIKLPAMLAFATSPSIKDQVFVHVYEPVQIRVARSVLAHVWNSTYPRGVR